MVGCCAAASSICRASLCWGSPRAARIIDLAHTFDLLADSCSLPAHVGGATRPMIAAPDYCVDLCAWAPSLPTTERAHGCVRRSGWPVRRLREGTSCWNIARRRDSQVGCGWARSKCHDSCSAPLTARYLDRAPVAPITVARLTVLRWCIPACVPSSNAVHSILLLRGCQQWHLLITSTARSQKEQTVPRDQRTYM